MFLWNWLSATTTSQIPETKNKSSSAAKTETVADKTEEPKSFEAKKMEEWRRLRREGESVGKSEDEVSIREKAPGKKHRPKHKKSGSMRRKLKGDNALTTNGSRRSPSAESVTSDPSSASRELLARSPTPRKRVTSAEALVDSAHKAILPPRSPRLPDEKTIRERRAKKKSSVCLKSFESQVISPENHHEISDSHLKKAFARAAEDWNMGSEEVSIMKAKPPYEKLEFETTAEVFDFVSSRQQIHKRVYRYQPDPWRRYASRKKIHEIGGFILPDSGVNDKAPNFSYVAKGSKAPPPPGSAAIMNEADQLRRMMPLTSPKSKSGKSKRKRVKESSDD